VLDRALLQVIQHLVARDLSGPAMRKRVLEVRDVEVADAPAAILPSSRSSSKVASVSASGWLPGQCSR
jgi:hypothetical protein